MGTEVKSPPQKFKYFFIIFYATLFCGARDQFWALDKTPQIPKYSTKFFCAQIFSFTLDPI